MWALSGIDDRRCIEDALSDVVLAVELGYESCWFGEHHHNRHKPFFGRVPNPELLIARFCAETKQIRLGTGVKVLPFDTPCRFAETVALLDILTGGRATYGVGMSMRADKAASTHERGAEFRSQLTELVRYLDREYGSDLEPITPEPSRDFKPLIWVAARDS